MSFFPILRPITTFFVFLLLTTSALAGAPENVATFNELSKKLEVARGDEFADNHHGNFRSNGDYAFYEDQRNASPRLKRWDDKAQKKVIYKFKIGEMDNANAHGSAALVVTAQKINGDLFYIAYDANEPNKEIARAKIEKPKDEQKWWAYAVDGDSVYIMLAKAEEWALMKWKPGSGEPQLVTTLQAAGVEDPGEFWEFGVEGDEMIFIESGRIWKLDLATKKAKFLKNKFQPTGKVNFAHDGVLYSTPKGLFFFKYADASTVNLSEEIKKVPFKITDTFVKSHHCTTDATHWKNYIVYVANDGVFAFEPDKKTITPILLSPRIGMHREDYRYPVVLDDGTLFINALVSESGSTGADGPFYKLSLKSILAGGK